MPVNNVGHGKHGDADDAAPSDELVDNGWDGDSEETQHDGRQATRSMPSALRVLNC